MSDRCKAVSVSLGSAAEQRRASSRVALGRVIVMVMVCCAGDDRSTRAPVDMLKTLSDWCLGFVGGGRGWRVGKRVVTEAVCADGRGFETKRGALASLGRGLVAGNLVRLFVR